VLEYQITRVERFPQAVQVFPAQREGMPVRRVDFVCRTGRDESQVSHAIFVFNKQSAQMAQNKQAKTTAVSATDLPSITIECRGSLSATTIMLRRLRPGAVIVVEEIFPVRSTPRSLMVVRMTNECRSVPGGGKALPAAAAAEPRKRPAPRHTPRTQ